MYESSSLDHLPKDITLKLSDGDIKANRSMLGVVSPVFGKMLYGNFKEASSNEVDLPEDNYRIMKLLFDIIFEGGSEIESLNDIIPLMEVVDRYQIKKGPVQQICDTAILNELNPLNCVNLLQKFTAVMDKTSVEEAGETLMCYFHTDFVSEFEKAKDLPEEVLLCMLQRNDVYNPEIDLFNFLVKWHDYQTKELNKTLNLVPQLFQSIRYFLISPQLLLTKVIDCSYIDKQAVMEALNCLHTMPLNERECCKGNEHNNCNTIKAPRHFCSIEWDLCSNAKSDIMQSGNVCFVKYCNTRNSGNSIIYSKPLKNGAYSFHISSSILCKKLSLSINTSHDLLYEIPADSVNFILFVYENDIFLKIIKDRKVCTTHSAMAQPPFRIGLNTDSPEVKITQNT